MGTLRFEYSLDTEGNSVLRVNDFKNFNASILGLGDISTDGEYFEALAAIFDLEAFTSFCNQIDPHLVIPEFLNEFLSWLFQCISSEFYMKEDGDKTILWGELPFFAKFLGDGVLFLWNTRDLSMVKIGNIVISLRVICDQYRKSFLPKIKKAVVRPPSNLRCGIARGQIISVGDGKDFVGPCINVASRLQKIGQFSFAMPKRGFNLNKCFTDSWHRDNFILIKTSIRGVGDEELVFVGKDEFDLLTDKEKSELLA